MARTKSVNGNVKQFPLASQGCERCPYGAVCRFEGLAARAAEEAG